MIGWHLAATEKLGWGPGQTTSADGRAHEEPDQAIWYEHVIAPKDDKHRDGMLTVTVSGGSYKVWIEKGLWDESPVEFTGTGEPDWDWVGICARQVWNV